MAEELYKVVVDFFANIGEKKVRVKQSTRPMDLQSAQELAADTEGTVVGVGDEEEDLGVDVGKKSTI